MIRWSPRKTLWFWGTGLPALWLLPSSLSWSTAAVGAVLGFGTFLFGHTIGLHRGVLHGSYETSRWLRNLLVWVFVLTGLGGPLWWIRAHNQRDHWQNQAQAPAWFRYDHTIGRDFWWNLHTVYDEPIDHLPSDAAADPWLQFLQRTWWLHNLVVFAALYAWGGLDHLVVGGLLRVWLGQVLHWWVGYEAHAHGEVRYAMQGVAECGRNRPWLGVVSLGEGFHNNHHAFPESAQIGHLPGEWDAGWAVLRAWEAAGWVWSVKRPFEVARRAGPTLQP